MNKTCSKCKIVHSLTFYNKCRSIQSGHISQCKTCTRKYYKKYRKKKGRTQANLYEKTKQGFLMRMYRNMLSRVRGIQITRTVSHLGQSIVGKEEFYQWALAHPDFHKLFACWETANYARKLSPSIDRIDPREGYEFLNMQFVTSGENTRRNNMYMHHGRIV